MVSSWTGFEGYIGYKYSIIYIYIYINTYKKLDIMDFPCIILNIYVPMWKVSKCHPHPQEKKMVILLPMILGTVAPYFLDHSNVFYFYWKTVVVKDGGLPFWTTCPPSQSLNKVGWLTSYATVKDLWTLNTRFDQLPHESLLALQKTFLPKTIFNIKTTVDSYWFASLESPKGWSCLESHNMDMKNSKFWYF